MSIQFDSIQVNLIEKNSGIFIGVNTQNYWNSQSKENYALGTVVGHHNLIQENINVVYDNDVVDTPIKNMTYQQSKKKTS